MRLKGLFYCLIVAVLLLVYACTKTETPTNPYAGLDHSTVNNNINPTEPDSNSITGLHKNIFSKRCANPGCHDGTFEPDYRTVQSTYSTLVYQKVNLTTVDNIHFFNYRVLPNDTSHSFLFERITTTTPDYMPSNSLVRLTQVEINHIKTWIMNGARDEFGNLPVHPDLQPNVLGFIALDPLYHRLDSIRQSGISYYPFLAPANTIMNLALFLSDTVDGTFATPLGNFTSVKIKCSTQKDNFTNATIITCLFNNPIQGYDIWQGLVNTALWSSGTTVYFRVYMNDGHHTTDAEFPRNDTFEYYKTYYAFYVQ